MRLPTLQCVMAVGLSLTLGLVQAAAPAIGTVTAKGAFRVDSATVSGNATLFEGSTIETNTAASTISLQSGARLSLGAASRGRLFGDHLVLERGAMQLDNGIGFKMQALGLTIQPDRAAATGRLLIQNSQGKAKVQVAALKGGFRILNSSGQVVANMSPGMLLAFEPQAGQQTATRVTGCLENRSGRYVLTDQTTNVLVEVAGTGVAGETGNRVELTGQMDPTATPVAGASQVIRVTNVRRVERGCSNTGAAAAAAAGAGGAAAGGAAAGGAAAGAGIGIGTVAVIGGVAAAAAVGGLAAADALPGQGDDEEPPPPSR